MIVLLAACSSGSPGQAPDGGPMVDASAPGAPARDGGVAEPDASIDAPADANPFPADPQGGELAWVVSVAGARDSVATAVDPAGNIVVAAHQTDEMILGDLRVPRPTGETVVVLKLTQDGKPLWAHALGSRVNFYPRSVATTASGDVIVGAAFDPDSTKLFDDDGLVTVLDGATGDERWSTVVASPGDDAVAGVATAGDALYVTGELGGNTTIAGQTVPPGEYVIRYDLDGTVRWIRSFPLVPGYNGALVVDPARGPVIVGSFSGPLALGGQTVTGRGLAIVALDPDGETRFVRPALTDRTPYSRYSLAIAPAGDLYLASDTQGTETVIEDHVIPFVDLLDHPYLARLTADGHYVAATQITGERSEHAVQTAIDAAGAAYSISSCDGRVDVQPERSCAGSQGGVIVAYGPDNAYRWATSINAAFVDAIAPAPGNRLIVAGQALYSTTDFGGVVIPTGSLFIAALAGGPARAPSPLPPSPAITSAVLDGAADGQIRQGDTGTLVIRGAALDHVTSARLGDVDVHVGPATATGNADELRLTIVIPHGHAPGPLDLELGNAAGVAHHVGTVTVTPVVVASRASADGRGTFSSPMPFCRADGFAFARYGDRVVLQTGTHECNRGIRARAGVTFRGESKAGTIVTGIGGANDQFAGFSTLSGTDDLGELAIENLTITSADLAAVNLGAHGRVAVTDVDVVGAAGCGVAVDGGIARVTRFRYLHGNATALVAGILAGSGEIDATDVVVDDAFRGAFMPRGVLRLTRAQLTSRETAVQVGDLNDQGGTREITIVSSTLRSPKHAFSGGLAQVTISDTTLEAVPSDTAFRGLELFGGTLTLTDSRVLGWTDTAIFTQPHFELLVPSAGAVRGTAVTLDGVEISGSSIGLVFQADLPTDRLAIHRSRIQTAAQAVIMANQFVADLGTAAVPGNNRFDAAAGPALVDARSTPGPAVDAHGTTLNGQDFAGDVLGPVTTSAYQLAGPTTIRF